MADHAPYDEPAPTSTRSTATDPTRPSRWHGELGATVGIVAAAVLINGAAFTWMLFHLISQFQHQHPGPNGYTFLLGSDLGQPLVGWVWFQLLLNGLVLVLPRRTRAVGLGVLVAVGLVALVVVGWLVLLLAT